MKTLKDIVEGYKKAMRAQAAYNRNLMKNIGKPVSSEYLDRRKALGDRVLPDIILPVLSSLILSKELV